MPLSAVRTVSEDDDYHTIEGLLAYGGPFNGKDTYHTAFSARTDWALRMHPAGIPVLFNHGFDEDFGYEPIGQTVPPASFRMEDDGLWVQMQLDKRQKYYATRVRPLLDRDGLGLSQGSAEHSVRVDERTGEVLAWPLHEVSLTPTESNPWNVIAARSGEIISIVDAVRKNDGPLPDLDEDHPTTSAALRSSSLDAAMAAGIAQSILFLRDCEMGEDDQVADLDAAFGSISSFIAKEMAEPPDEDDAAYMSAMRAGRRNSTVDQQHVDAIHTHITALGASAHSSDQPADEDDEDAARTAEPLTTVHIVERADAEVPRIDIDAIAARTAAETVRRLTG